jgi:tripartite ATP-independent transporter DctP family solute receptor
MTMRTQRVKLGSLLSVLLLVGGAVLLASVDAEAGARRTLKLGTILPPENILSMNAQEFAKKVNERSKGEVEVVVYPNSQLGNERDLTEGLQLGTVEMAEVSGGVMSIFAPEAGVFSLPFIFQGWDHLDKVLKSPPAERLGEIFLKKTGVRTLGWMEQGFRVTLTTKKVINSVADFDGLKIRVPEDKVLVRTFQLVKARPTVIPWGEVYTSLQTGVVEGMESTTPAMYTMKFFEVANYIAETNHQHSVVGFLISDKVFQSLSKSAQDVIVQAAKETLDINYRDARGTAEKSLDLLRAKVKQTTKPDLKPFQDAVQPVYKEFAEQTGTGEIIRQVQAVR